MCKMLWNTPGTRLVLRIVSGVQMVLKTPPMALDKHAAQHSSHTGHSVSAHTHTGTPPARRNDVGKKATPPRNTLSLYIYTAEGTGAR